MPRVKQTEASLSGLMDRLRLHLGLESVSPVSDGSKAFSVPDPCSPDTKRDERDVCWWGWEQRQAEQCLSRRGKPFSP